MVMVMMMIKGFMSDATAIVIATSILQFGAIFSIASPNALSIAVSKSALDFEYVYVNRCFSLPGASV